MSTATASAPVAATLPSMLSELQSAEQKVLALKATIDSERTKRLAGLHAELGYTSSDELIAAIRMANGGKATRARKTNGRKERTKVTSDIRKGIIADAKAGTLTSLEIATKHGVSVGTVQNIKKDAHLTA